MIKYKVKLHEGKLNQAIIIFLVYVFVKTIYNNYFLDSRVFYIMYIATLIAVLICLCLITLQLLFGKEINVYVTDKELMEIDDNIIEKIEEYDNCYMIGFAPGFELRPVFIKSKDLFLYRLMDIPKNNRYIISNHIKNKYGTKITWEEFFND